ncbi:TraQ conjugal transfer family protein [Capnocytophaga sputigena]|jgi:conjugative transposon protein traQ|uniref:TraQ conjugal transfer family protein n=1 Tax=Capnocytophaga sputigena TaxID=1019 RepID=UPI0028EC3C8D|nr:TraQ conjugal transfer family protein [Capnocytophaga sputigena]
MKKINQKIVIGLIAMLCVSLFTSCKKELDVQQNFPFEVKVLPIPKQLPLGATAELRLEILPTQVYRENAYSLRYFSFEGKGSLRFEKGTPFIPNDSYPITHKVFRLYYTAHSIGSHAFTLWLTDSFGNEKKIECSLQVQK